MENNIIIDEKLILEKYRSKINYYWRASCNNKRSYKLSRMMIIVLGAFITLFSAISSASFVASNDYLKLIFAIVTPILATFITIIGGFAQSFQWGATWRDMVLNAEILEKELDCILATKNEERNYKQELEILNNMVITESQNFFKRVLESDAKPKEKD